MKKNMGFVDRAVRVSLALVVVILFVSNQITGIAAIILGTFAGILLLTSVLGFCPLYLPFKLSTDKKKAGANV